MKTEVRITEITHDDLVTLLSTATFDSDWLAIRRKAGTYKGTNLVKKEYCLEDTWAAVLLNGKPVYAYDYYAEDSEEYYGNLPHDWNSEKGAMRYTLTLEDIRLGLQKCLSGDFRNTDTECKTYIRSCMNHLIDGGYDLDAPEAENLMQVILFGEIIYG